MRLISIIFVLMSLSSLSHAYTSQCLEKAHRLVTLDKEFWSVSRDFDNETHELKKRSLVNEINVLEEQTALAFGEAQRACGSNIPGY